MLWRHRWPLLLLLVAALSSHTGAGPMRSYTGDYHPAGGEAPRYLSDGQGAVVPNLRNPRIPAPGMLLIPQHYAERYYELKAGSITGQEMADYEESYDYDESDNIVYPDLVVPDHFRSQLANSEGGSRRTHHTRYSPRMRTIVLENNAADAEDEEIDDGIGNESPGYDGASTAEDSSFPAAEALGCQDGDIVYSLGDIFILGSDPCTQCNCTSLGQICSIKGCEPLPASCLELQVEPGDCCPVCLRSGCEFQNVTYSVGEVIRETPCQTCRCEEDGHADCSVADCIPPRCVDPVVRDGECCPVCPDGPNCYAINHTIIAARAEWVTLPNDRCTICRCRHEPAGLELWMGNRDAECKRNPLCTLRERGIYPLMQHTADTAGEL